jgi:hypothetical protein
MTEQPDLLRPSGKGDNIVSNKYRSRYYLDHREEMIARAMKWNREHPEKVRAHSVKWCRTHPEKKRDNNLKWRREHPESRENHRIRSAKWKREHPDKVRTITAKRRARKRNAPGRFTVDDITRIYKEQRGLCAYCRVPLKNKYHVEHRVPLARGGSNWPKNICLSCGPCNNRKHTKTVEEFLATMIITEVV